MLYHKTWIIGIPHMNILLWINKGLLENHREKKKKNNYLHRYADQLHNVTVRWQ